MAGIWSLFSAIGYFRNISIYNGNHASQLVLFSIILGVLYMVVVVIEIFAFFASPVKIPLVRTYAYLSGLVVLIAAAIGLIEIVVHFVFKNTIISECTDLNEGDTVIIGGIFGPQSAGTLSPADARDWCTNAWNRGSWSDIISFLIITFLAGFFSVIAFSYLRQVLDPSHPANTFREPAHRMGNFPSHYNPPYNPTYANYPSYPAPAGPPPNQSTDAFVPPYDGKPPGYIRGDDFKGGFGDMHKGGDFDDGPSERDIVPTSRPF